MDRVWNCGGGLTDIEFGADGQSGHERRKSAVEAEGGRRDPMATPGRRRSVTGWPGRRCYCAFTTLPWPAASPPWPAEAPLLLLVHGAPWWRQVPSASSRRQTTKTTLLSLPLSAHGQPESYSLSDGRTCLTSEICRYTSGPDVTSLTETHKSGPTCQRHMSGPVRHVRGTCPAQSDMSEAHVRPSPTCQRHRSGPARHVRGTGPAKPDMSEAHVPPSPTCQRHMSHQD